MRMRRVTNGASPMTDVHLALVQSSLVCGPRGTVTGQLYFRTDASTFPDDVWNDFALVLLGWWVEALIPLLQGQRCEAELLFMDGPFLVRVERDEAGDCSMEFVDRARDRVVGRGSIQLDELFEQVTRAAKAVLEFSEEEGGAAADVEALRRGLAGIASS